jgi:formylglycine-generating enzyme required for sulfatase activity
MTTDFRRAPYLSDYWTTRDFLRFSDFCSPLLSILMEAQTPLTVGVFGPWGSGKTSLMRMLREEIDRKGLRFVRTVWFTAWKYDRQEALWRAFILRVLEALYPRVPREQWGDAEKKLAAHLDRMVESVYRAVEWEEAARWALDLGRLGKEAAKLPGFLLLSSAGAGALAEALGISPDLAEAVRREVQTARLEQLVSMEQFEDRFRQALAMALQVEKGAEDRRRLIVFVDDLDRCLPEKAVEVLETIKLFLEVEGTVFVLGADREVIERGIETRYAALFRRAEADERAEMPIRGDAYLQKIVQIPFHLPPLSVEDVGEYIGKLEANLPAEARLDETTLQVFAHGLLPNPRQVKRALNIFRLLKEIARERLPAGSVAWPLLAKTVLIQTQWPDLYRLWRQYPTLVQTLEEEYARHPWTEEEAVRGRSLQAEEVVEGVKGEPARKGGLLEPYLTRRTEYSLLYQMLTFPEEAGEGEARARFSGLTRSQMEVYVRLAGAVELETPVVELPGDLMTDLLSGDRARIQDAVARLEEREPDREGALHRRMREQLLGVMRDPARPARERVSAGDALAFLGDPRFRPDLWYLPDEPLLGFVEIPEGPFLMGSNSHQHEVILPTYYIARYPVTVAQWRAFVEDSKHEPENLESLREVDNHPVVWVSWLDAIAYCRWLTEKLKSCEETQEPLATLLRKGGWVITLPSEAQWEKAARGTDGRKYPWGNKPILIKRSGTTPVGCYSPQTDSPYGCTDMAGHVWQWTSESGDRPGRYVIRGGGYFPWEGQTGSCTDRSEWGPYGYKDVGFRVVISFAKK